MVQGPRLPSLVIFTKRDIRDHSVISPYGRSLPIRLLHPGRLVIGGVNILPGLVALFPGCGVMAEGVRIARPGPPGIIYSFGMLLIISVSILDGICPGRSLNVIVVHWARI